MSKAFVSGGVTGGTLKPNWFKFIYVAVQYIFIGRYRCLEGKDLEDWNNASV
jgi:hypothetical protein